MTVRWLAVGAATAGVAALMSALGAPSPALFAALAAGIAYALLVGAHPLAVPRAASTAAQALIGVSLGAAMQGDTLRAVAQDWFAIAVVLVGTLGASLAAGIVLAARTGVSRKTGMLGLVAGGASGIVAMSDELGADSRLVAFMQYLRVLVVVLLAPLVALVFLPDGDGSPATAAESASFVVDLGFTVGCALAGALLARVFRVTAGSLLGPMIVAAAVMVSGVVSNAAVPALLEYGAFVVIGLQVGLRFTVATVVEARRLLGPVLVALAMLIAACAGLAVLLVPLADVTFADAYLATTPGGLYAVLATSIDIGADTTFIVSVQALRVLVLVLAAPAVIRVLARGEPRRDDVG